MTGRKLVRVMKSRHSGWLGCGRHANIGDLIVKVNGRPWICTPCRLAEVRELEQTMTALPRPSERGAGQLQMPLEAS